MQNWQVMKDVSYVGIKSMKARSISEGLTRCRIQRLSRQNPIYEHLMIHKLRKGKSECNLCKSAVVEVKPPSSDKTHTYMTSRVDWKSPSRINTEPTQTASTKASKLPFSKCYNYKSWSALQRAIESTAKTEAINHIDQIKNVIEKFDDGLRRTKSNFNKLTHYSKRVQDYFLTEIDEIQLELNQDKGLSIAQVRTDRTMMLQEMHAQRKRQMEVAKKVKKMNEPIQYPLNAAQMKKIVNEQTKKNIEAIRLKKMMTSIYDYKSKINYENKMKIVRNVTQK